MTICIAVPCRHDGEPAIALCTDQKTSFGDGWTSCDSTSKLMSVAYGWCALLSGQKDIAKDLAIKCGEFLKSNSVNALNAINRLSIPLQQFQHSFRNSAISRWGISYDDYLNGRVADEREHQSIQQTLNALPTDYSILLTSIVDDWPFIAKVGHSGITTTNSYAVIGIGDSLAAAILNERNVGDVVRSAEQVLYLVYEAKQFSERAGDISKETTLLLQYKWKSELAETPLHNLKFADSKAFERLTGLRDKLGLQPLDNHIPPINILLSGESGVPLI